VRIVAEPGGSAAFAALLSGAYRPASGERVGVVVSGANTTRGGFLMTKASDPTGFLCDLCALCVRCRLQ